MLNGGAHVVEPLHDVVDEPVVAGLLGAEPAVPQAVAGHRFLGLAGVLRDQPGHRGSRPFQLLGVDLDIGGGAAEAGRALVHQHLSVRQAEPLAGGPGAQQELAHAAGQAHGQRPDVVGDQLHRVVDGQPRGDRAARGVDVEADVAARVLGRQQQQLGAEPVGDPVVDLGAEYDDALVEQPGGQLVIEHPGERCGFGHGRLHDLPAFSSGAGNPAAPSTMVRPEDVGQDNLPTAEKTGDGWHRLSAPEERGLPAG